MPLPRTPLIALVGITAALVLAGCSGGSDTAASQSASPSSSASTSASPSPSTSDSSDGEQTTAEACAIVQDALATIQTDVSGSLETAQSDPAAAAQALDTAATNFSTSIATVENPDIAAAAQPAVDSLSSLADTIGSYVTDPASADPQALSDAATGLQTSVTELATACTNG